MNINTFIPLGVHYPQHSIVCHQLNNNNNALIIETTALSKFYAI